MKYEKCETCGEISFGKWGIMAVIGFSIIAGSMGYVLSRLYYDQRILAPLIIIAVVLYLPVMYIQSIEGRKQND